MTSSKLLHNVSCTVSCDGKVLVHNVVYCDHLLRQGTGLMFRSRNSVNDTVWWFRFKSPRKVTITMFFVFFPIDVIFLDDKDRIIEIRQDLKPFTNYTSKNEVHAFIELEKGVVKNRSLRVGMRLSCR